MVAASGGRNLLRQHCVLQQDCGQQGRQTRLEAQPVAAPHATPVCSVGVSVSVSVSHYLLHSLLTRLLRYGRLTLLSLSVHCCSDQAPLGRLPDRQLLLALRPAISGEEPSLRHVHCRVVFAAAAAASAGNVAAAPALLSLLPHSAATAVTWPAAPSA